MEAEDDIFFNPRPTEADIILSEPEDSTDDASESENDNADDGESATSGASDLDVTAARLCKELFRWTCLICLSNQPVKFEWEDNGEAHLEFHPIHGEVLDFCRTIAKRRQIFVTVQRIKVAARVAAQEAIQTQSVLEELRDEAIEAAVHAQPSDELDIDTRISAANGAELHAHVHKTVTSGHVHLDVELVNDSKPWNSSVLVLLEELRALDSDAADAIIANSPALSASTAPAHPFIIDFDYSPAAISAPVLPASLFKAQLCSDCCTPYLEPSPSALVSSDAVNTSEVLFEAEGAAHSHHAGRTGVQAVPESEASSASFNVNEDICAATMKLSNVKADANDKSLTVARAYVRRHGIAPELINAILTGVDNQVVQNKFGHRVALVYDDRMLLHEEAARTVRDFLRSLNAVAPRPPPSYHPERPDRLRAIAQHLVATGVFQRCMRVPARECCRHELEGVHSSDYLDNIDTLNEVVAEHGGNFHFGSDTFASAHTLKAAKLSCGATLAVTEEVVLGRADRGVALVRPPGHHAEPDVAMGFCIYNNVAIAAWCAIHLWGMSRVLVVDWDVHHGNGTENMFYDDPSVLYVSLHRHDGGAFYPGTGHTARVGLGAGAGYNVNIAWPKGGMGDAEYMAAFEEIVMPIARNFNPQLVIISAGFDAARGDPLGGCDLTPIGYAHMTHQLLSLASGRVVVVLEGGYNLRSISRSMEAVVRVLLGEAVPPLHTPPHRIHAKTGTATAAASETAASADDDLQSRAARLLGESEGLATRFGGRTNPSPTQSLLPPDATANVLHTTHHTEDEEGEAEFKGIDRDGVLLSLAPRHDALIAIAQCMRAHSSFWPALALKLSAMAAVSGDDSNEESGEGSSSSDGEENDEEIEDGNSESEPAAKRLRQSDSASEL